MHFTAVLALVTVLIPAVTPTPAASPQSAEIDIHLELNSKDLTGLFNGREAKTDYDYDSEAGTGPSLDYSFRLKGHLEHGLPSLNPQPSLFYRFEGSLPGRQGILSSFPSTFSLQDGNLLLGRQAVGLRGPFEKGPAPAVLGNPSNGLNFTIHQETNGIQLLHIDSDIPLIFQGSNVVSGEGDLVGINIPPSFWPHPTTVTWIIEKIAANIIEDEVTDNGPFKKDDQDVLARDSLKH